VVLGLGGASDSLRPDFKHLRFPYTPDRHRLLSSQAGGCRLPGREALSLASASQTLCAQEVGARGYARNHVRTLCQLGKPTGPDGGVRGR
jgi:hypothetical protein